MRSTYTINPAAGGQLITEYAGTFPGGLTVINTGQNTVYLGDDSGVSPSNGIPLTPGMATVWSAQFLYAAAATATTILITDNASNPLTTNLPTASPSDEWDWSPQTQTLGMIVAGTSSDPQLNPTSTAQCAYKIPMQTVSTSHTLVIGLVSTFTGQVTTIATIAVPLVQTTMTGIVNGVVLPFGGYSLQLTFNGNGGSPITIGASTVTLVHT